MIGLIIRLIRIIFYVADKTHPPELRPVEEELFPRKARTGAAYLKIATNAMIIDGKNMDEVKELLRKKGLYEDNIELYAKKAKQQYDQWESENAGKPRLTALEQYERDHKKAASADPAIMLTSTDPENYSNQFCALVGKKRFYVEEGRTALYAITTAALKSNAVMETGDTTLKQSTFQRFGGGDGNPWLRVVSINGQQSAVFPYLRTESILPFQSKKILEWDNDDPFEAELEGICHGQYALSFFATDYAVKKETYKLKQDINIRLSAFLFSITESAPNKDNPGYKTNNKYGASSYFSFEGEVLSIKGANVSNVTIGGIFTLKIAGNSMANDLVVDAYATNVNVLGEKVKKGMQVKGTLWFQGEIAD